MPAGQRSYKHLMFNSYSSSSKSFKRLLICNWIVIAIILYTWVKYNGGLLPQFVLKTEQLGPGSNIVDHFPETGQDGSMVIWAHGTNSKETLMAAVEDPKVMMIEGEVVLRGQNTAQQELLPVMLSSSEELTFDDWFSLALQSGKGLKLDFKTIEPVEICMQKLERRRDLLKKPVHLGADILATSKTEHTKFAPVDAQRFLRLTSQHFPQATIVVGWTVNPEETRRYDWSMVMDMYSLLSKRDIQQPISLSIHAMLSRESIPAIKWLSEMLDATVTVLSSKDDRVNPNDFLFLRNKFPKHKVYYDMHHKNVMNKETEHPQKLAEDLQKLQNIRIRTEQWKPVSSEYAQKVYIASESVVMQSGLLIYSEDPYVFTNEPMVIHGRLTMFNMPTNLELRKDIGITISLHESANVKPNSKEGIRCYIGLDGLLKITAKIDDDVVPRVVEESSNQDTGCYIFEIQELVGRKVTMSVEHALDCSSTSYYQTFETSKTSVDLDISEIEYKHNYVTVTSSNAYGYIAIEVLKVN